MTEERVRRKLSGILSADAVSYSRLMQADEASTIRTLEDIKKLMSELIEQFKGRVVDAPGDKMHPVTICWLNLPAQWMRWIVLLKSRRNLS
jgi:class 3 adenylate cyclase